MALTLLRCGKAAMLLAAVAIAGCTTAPAQPTGKDIVWETPRPSTSPAPVPSGTGAAGAAPSQPSAAPADTSDGCREYSQTVIIDGQEQQAYGRVCRQSDGSWRVVQPADLPPLPGPPAQVAAYPVYYPAYYPRYYYPPPFFFGSAFFYSAHRHHHHRHHHHHHHRHRRR